MNELTARPIITGRQRLCRRLKTTSRRPDRQTGPPRRNTGA